MESQPLATRRVNDNLVKQNRILERKCAANEQYSRRKYLEISGIPDSISNNNLEETVLKIFNETGYRKYIILENGITNYQPKMLF